MHPTNVLRGDPPEGETVYKPHPEGYPFAVDLVGGLKRVADADLVIYCHHGVRSWHAALYLEQAGFERVHSLGGGIDAYSQAINPAIPRY